MRKIDPSEITDNAIDLIGRQWMLVTSGDIKSFNMMTASWGMIGVMWNLPVATCVIRPSRYTHQWVERTMRYTLTFFDSRYKKILGELGTKSGRDMDKMHDSGLTPIALPSGDISYAEARLTLVCEVVYRKQYSEDGFIDKSLLPKWYPEGLDNLHTMYIGHIVEAYAAE